MLGGSAIAEEPVKADEGSVKAAEEPAKAAKKPVKKNCQCKNCPCTPESHCGCYSEAGCKGDCKCGEKRRD